MRSPFARLRPGSSNSRLLYVIGPVTAVAVLASWPLSAYQQVHHEARVVALKAVSGSLRLAVAVTKGQAMLQGADCSQATGQRTRVEGQEVALSFCAPEPSAAGIERVAGLDTNSQLLTVLHAVGGSSSAVQIAKAAQPQRCQALYTPPSAPDGTAQITLLFDGC